jgi:hypothetical protein
MNAFVNETVSIYLTITILDIIYRPAFYFNRIVSETEFCLCSYLLSSEKRKRAEKDCVCRLDITECIPPKNGDRTRRET